MMSQSPQLMVLGYPRRFNIDATTTGATLHELAWHVVKRFVKTACPFQPSTGQLPFTLATTDLAAAGVKSVVGNTDAPLAAIGVAEEDVLLILWANEADRPEYVDYDEFSREIQLPSPADAEAAPPPELTLQKCLEQYTEKEHIFEHTTPCPCCGAAPRAAPPVKRLGLWTAPDTLVLHLKRFSATQGQFGQQFSDKIECMVRYPLRGLDLAPYRAAAATAPREISPFSTVESGGGGGDAALTEGSGGGGADLYDLYAVSHHLGGSIHGGHYTATCLNPVNKRWYHFNDSHVSAVPAAEAVAASAYLLFYRRRGAESAAGEDEGCHPSGSKP